MFIPNVFQYEALKAINEKIYEEKKGTVVMPTGTGKTFLIVLKYLEDLKIDPNAKLLFICHNNDILSQANEKEFKSNLNNLNIQYGYYNGYEKNIQQVTFATTQTLARNLEDFAPDYFDFVIVDEAHHYQARTFKRVIDYFNPKIFKLGLTATPNRTDNKNIFTVCGKQIYKADIKNAIEKNLLCKINYWCVDHNIDFSDVKWNNRNYDIKDLNRKICIKEYDDAILNEYITNAKEKNKRKKTIAFCSTVEHAHRMSDLFNKNGISAMALTGKDNNRNSISKQKRNDIISKFRNGIYEVIFVRDLFNEGIDIPDADCILLLRPTKSNIVFTQQIGRGLRIADGKDYLLVLDFIGNARNCDITYEVLNEIFGIDILNEVKLKSKDFEFKPNEIILENVGCTIRLTKTQIDLFDMNQKKKKLVFPNHESFLKFYFEKKKEAGKWCGSGGWGLTLDQIVNSYNVSEKWISNTYGGWHKFLDKIGEEHIYVREVKKFDTKDEFEEYYKKMKEESLRFPTIDELNVSTRWINKKYGSWELFFSKMGVPDMGRHDEYIYSYEKLKEKMGRDPTYDEYMKIGRYLNKGEIKEYQYNEYPEWINFMRDVLKEEHYMKNDIEIISRYKPKTNIHENSESSEFIPQGNKKGFKRWKRGYKNKEDLKMNIREKIVKMIKKGNKILILESPELMVLREIVIQYDMEEERLRSRDFMLHPEKQGKDYDYYREEKKTHIEIVIPNNLEFDKLKEAILKWRKESWGDVFRKLDITLVNTSALQYLADTDEKFDLIWLDYCGAFSYYTKDLDMVFKNDTTDLKLILTYNIFDPIKKDESYYFTNVIDYVLEKVKKPVRLIKEISYRYKKNMFNIGFMIDNKEGIG